MIIGTETGLFARTSSGDSDQIIQTNTDKFIKILELEKVTQIEMLPTYDMFLILAGISK
jgi:hypothetical protein